MVASVAWGDPDTLCGPGARIVLLAPTTTSPDDTQQETVVSQC